MKFRKRNLIKNEKGVSSLVEIVIIVSVLMVLIAASVANFTGAKTRAQVRKSCAALNNIRQTLFAFKTDNDYYPSTISNFTDMYTQLSASGLDNEPKNGVDFKNFESYTQISSGTYYNLVVRSQDVKGVILTATPDLITAVDGSNNYNELCR